MTLKDWLIFHSMTWGEFGALVDCNPVWARQIAQGSPCSKELAERIHKLTNIWPKIGRGRNWRKGADDGTMRTLAILIREGTPRDHIMTLMGYKNRESTRAMISKAKRRVMNERAKNRA